MHERVSGANEAAAAWSAEREAACVISGTDFIIVEWPEVLPLIEHRALRACTVAELDDVAAEFRTHSALCLRSPDGIVVIALQPQGEVLELFVRLAVGFRPGAFARAESSLVDIAQELTAQTIAFRPARRGWKRLLGEQWLKRGEDYVRSVHGSDPDSDAAPADAALRPRDRDLHARTFL